MTRTHTSDDLIVLNSPDIQLIVHAMPKSIAETVKVTAPPQRRENSAMKFFFTVPSIASAASRASALGGLVFAEQWEGPGFSVRNACDPEGNIFQVREIAP